MLGRDSFAGRYVGLYLGTLFRKDWLAGSGLPMFRMGVLVKFGFFLFLDGVSSAAILRTKGEGEWMSIAGPKPLQLLRTGLSVILFSSRWAKNEAGRALS